MICRWWRGGISAAWTANWAGANAASKLLKGPTSRPTTQVRAIVSGIASKLMTDQHDLRNRIATIIDQKVDGHWEPLDVADALIRELGLVAEYSYGTTYPNVPVRDRRLVRFVTDYTEAATSEPELGIPCITDGCRMRKIAREASERHLRQ